MANLHPCVGFVWVVQVQIQDFIPLQLIDPAHCWKMKLHRKLLHDPLSFKCLRFPYHVPHIWENPYAYCRFVLGLFEMQTKPSSRDSFFGGGLFPWFYF